MPREEREPEPPKSWAEWKEELGNAIEDLDRACANARQVIYRLRPLVRPKDEANDERDERRRRPTSFNSRRQFRRERS